MEEGAWEAREVEAGEVAKVADFVAILPQGMGDLCAMDLVPEPAVVAAALRACRRVNDYSLTTRWGQ